MTGSLAGDRGGVRRREVSDSAIMKHGASDWVCEWDIPKVWMCVPSIPFFMTIGSRSFWTDHPRHGRWLSIIVLCALVDSWAKGDVVHLDSQ